MSMPIRFRRRLPSLSVAGVVPVANTTVFDFLARTCEDTPDIMGCMSKERFPELDVHVDAISAATVVVDPTRPSG